MPSDHDAAALSACFGAAAAKADCAQAPEGEINMNMERIYKTMRNAGAGVIAMGIVVATVGVAVGVISIITGAILLKRKSEIEF